MIPGIPTVRPSTEIYFSTWVREFIIPAVLVSLDLEVLWTNPAADSLFSSCREFHVTNGYLGFSDTLRAEEFRRFLAGVGTEPRVWINRRSEGEHQLIRAEALRPEGLEPAVALMIYPTGPTSFYWAEFDKTFSLTPAEAAVAKRIVSGESADAIAENLSVSLDTVRTHIRRVYAKLGINSREQLFATVSPFRLR